MDRIRVPRSTTETPFQHGKRVGVLQTIGFVLAELRAENPGAYEALEEPLLEYAETHTGIVVPRKVTVSRGA